jgi:lipopolysaccharide transport system permease protein
LSAVSLVNELEQAGNGKPDTLRIEPRGNGFGFGELWRYRGLLYFLVWRDVKVRYKQTMLGIAWAVIQPTMTMVVFTIFFGRFAGLPSEGIPYPLFTFVAVLPWQLFATALQESSNSLVANQHLISKVYFPRLILPIAAMLAALVDFVVAMAVLVVLMIYYGVSPSVMVVLLPAMVVLTLVSALSVSLWLSALNVRYRDIRYLVPFVIQLWLFATPIAYSATMVPQELRTVWALNPMTVVVDGFRWALLDTRPPDPNMVLVSASVVVTVLLFGLFYFRRAETTFADVV